MLLRLFSYGEVGMLYEENPINTCSAQRTKTIEGSGLFVVLVQGVRNREPVGSDKYGHI